MKRISLAFQLLRNMGVRYVLFRVKFLLQTKTGFLKNKFPINPPIKSFISLEKWKSSAPQFFFDSREVLKKSIVLEKEESLKLKVDEIKQGVFTFFSSLKFDLGQNYDWVTNPDTKFKYDIKKHFTEIVDLNKEAGDIKYVWEKARFSWLYTLIRYDLKSGDDQSEFVFKEIESFIDQNPINQGPNYKCSQEISLRVMNWLFALYYYKQSGNLTEARFTKIMHAIYWQVHHVYHNIDFSRIAVRNNHAITETLLLLLSGVYFPFFPNAKKWSSQGRKWFEQEVAYQVYKDGTFLQFSMNYHRVVIQLLTWAIKLTELNNQKLGKDVYDRAKKSVTFLDTCLDKKTGWLPNYGANDGALFFGFTNENYRNYKPQLDALNVVLGEGTLYSEDFEDTNWYQGESLGKEEKKGSEKLLSSFEKGGYYVINEQNEKTFIRCGNHKDRPSQADNLHLDLWYKGQNIMRDAGSYKYNTTEENINYFNGTQSHNTVSVNGENQMLKGSRFIWYNWSQAVFGKLHENEKEFIFEGEIEVFKEINNGLRHFRKVVKTKGKPQWVITDEITGSNLVISQSWNPSPSFLDEFDISSVDKNGELIKKEVNDGEISDYYGVKYSSKRVIFNTNTSQVTTTIQLKKIE